MMMKLWNRKNSKKGFTLVELIVVIAILVILAAILIPVVSGYIKDAQDTTAYANARTVYTAAAAYFAKNTMGAATSLNATSTPTAATALGQYLGDNFGTYTVVADSGEITEATWTDGTLTASYKPNEDMS